MTEGSKSSPRHASCGSQVYSDANAEIFCSGCVEAASSHWYILEEAGYYGREGLSGFSGASGIWESGR